MASNYKNKKGATGKKYTTVGDVIKVTYTDGSTRVVRPTDASYKATKDAMEKDIGSKKWYKPAGNSKTTAQTALGTKSTGAGVVTTAKQNQQNEQYKQTMQKRRAQEAQQKAVAEVAKKEGITTPVNRAAKGEKAPLHTFSMNAYAARVPVVKDVENDRLTDALSHGARTGANTAISGIKTGLIGAGQTVADIVGADDLANDLASQLRLASAKQQLDQQRIDAQYNTNFGGAAKLVSDVTAGAVGMLPTIGSFVLLPSGKIAAAGKAAQLGAKAIGFAPLALQSGGGGINQALNEGATIEQAKMFGLGSMAKELGTEIVFGGIPYVPGFKNLGDMAANMVKGETAKKIAGAAGKMAGEGIEEAAATYAEPFIERATYNEDAENASLKDVAYTGLVGGLTAGALNAGAKAVPNRQEIMKNDYNRAFEALHGQKMVENPVQNAQTAQNSSQQAQDNQTTERIALPPKSAETGKYEAEFTPKTEKNIQNDLSFESFRNTWDMNDKLRYDSLKFVDDMIEKVRSGYEPTNAEQKRIDKTLTRLGIEEQFYGSDIPVIEDAIATELAGFEMPYENWKKSEAIRQQNAESDAYAKQMFNKQKTPRQNVVPEPTLEMSERTLDNVSDKKVRLYQQEHPEVQLMQQETAEALLSELKMGIKGGRDAGIDPETRNVTQMGGWQRQQSEPIERMLQNGLTYSQIESGLNQLIANESTTNSKKVELFVNEALRKGYQSVTGESVGANQAYAYRGMTAEQLQQEQDRLLEAMNNPEYSDEQRQQLLKQASVLFDIMEQGTVRENRTVAENTTVEPEPVQHFSEYTGQNVTPEVRTFLDSVSKKIGKDVAIVNSLPKGANGMFSGGKIYLDGNKLTSMETVRRLTAHEVYHSMKNTPEFRKLQDVAMDFYRSINPELTNDILVQDKIREYADAGEQLDVDGAYDELTADFMEVALIEPEVAERIWSSEPTLGQRIAEFIQRALQSFRNRKLSAMERQQKQLLTQAQKLYSKGLQSMKYQGSEASGTRYNIDTGLKAQFDKWLQGNMEEDAHFDLGMTPESLKKFGAKELPIVMTQDVIVKFTGGKHSIALDEAAKLPDQIANPVMLFKGSVPNSFVVLTEITDKSGNEVVAAIHLNRMQKRMQVNRIASLYGKNNIENYVKNNIDAGNLLDADTKKASQWFTNRGLQLPKLVQTITDAKNILPEKQEKVNELSIEPDGSGQVQNPSGEVVAEQSEGVNRFNLTTYESGGKKALEKYIRKMSTRGLMDSKDGKEIVDYMDFVYDKVKELTTGENTGEYQYFTAWSEAKPMINEDGIPVLSVVTANGEYPMNLDFSQRCAKRVSMDNLLTYLTKNDMYDISKLSPEDFQKINQVLKENGFDIACSMCYVESKRDKSSKWANIVASEYNELLEAANIKNGVVDEESLMAKRNEMDLRKKANGKSKEVEESVDDYTGGLSMKLSGAYAEHIRENAAKAKPLKAADLMYSEGMARLKADAPKIYGIAARRFGAGTPKPLTPEAVYNSEILSASLTGQTDDRLNPNRWTPEAAFEAGGVRLQSFSDYRANMFFDYCQLFADMAARRFPAQAYTKVESFVRLFGMTGAKINMSIIPEVKLTTEDRVYIDSLSDNKKKKDSRYLKMKETAGLDENGDYLWAAESFDFETAKELQNDDRYTDNVGTVAIGVSDAHIRKMMQDDDIRMIIPYHASGLNKDMARMKNIDLFTDYTYCQNNTYAKGEKMPNESWADYYARITKGGKYGTKVKKEDNKLKFNFYDDLMETGDPVETSQNYVEACQNAGIVPKFPQFVYNPDGSFNENYYKVITDFTLYNKHGEPSLQSVVKFDEKHLPEDWRDILMADLKKSQASHDKAMNEMADVAEQVVDAISNDTRYSLSQIGGSGGKSRYQELIDKYGSMKPGENPNGTNRDIPVPKQTSDWDKTRQWTRTAMEAEQVEDITVGMIADDLTSDMQSGRFIYEPTSNQEQVDRANRLINQTGWEQQKEQFRNKYRSGEAMTADDIVLGERLIQEAQKAGDYETAVQLIADVAAIGTEAGRSVQALKVLKRLTPEGQVAALKRIEQRINGSLTAQGKEPVALPGDIAQQMLQARGSDKQAEIWDKAIKELANQVPATLADKINAWRYLAMLSNPKTHIRNMVGNATMRTVMSVKNLIQTGVETAMSPLGIERTAAIRVPKEYREFAKWDYENNAKQMLAAGGGRYNDEIGLIAQNKRIFNNRALEGARKFNSGLLDAEDMIFKKAAYIDAMSRYMYANGLSPSVMQSQASRTGATYEQGQNFAVEQAKKATFQEASKLAQKLAEIENMNSVSKIVMGAMVPFKKTPINILKRGFEYSPVGVMNGIKKAAVDIRTGKATPAEAIDTLTAGLTGTGIMMLGYFMASNGLLSGGADDDDQRKARYDSQMGSQNYALVLPDGSTYTIDWLAPSVMPLMVGAELQKQLSGDVSDSDNATGFTRALEAIAKVGNPVLEMSMMQGVTDALQSYNSGTGQFLSDFITSSASSYGGQFIPAPVGALARTVDDIVRSSYAPKDSQFGKEGETFLRQQANKLPGVSKSMQPSIDVWGNERKREGDTVPERLLHNMFNPGNYSSNKRTDLDIKLDELYKATGNSAVLPKTATNYIDASEQNPKVYLNSEEYTKFAKTKGQKSQKYVSDFVNSTVYNSLDNNTRADIVADLYNLANYEARKEALTGRSIDYSTTMYENALGSGVEPYEYYATKSRFGGKWSDYEDAAKFSGYADQMQMLDDKFVEVYDSISDLKADKDKNGKSISGSRQEKVEKYLNGELKAGNITKEQWWYFWTKEYSSKAKNAPYDWIREANK